MTERERLVEAELLLLRFKKDYTNLDELDNETVERLEKTHIDVIVYLDKVKSLNQL